MGSRGRWPCCLNRLSAFSVPPTARILLHLPTYVGSVSIAFRLSRFLRLSLDWRTIILRLRLNRLSAFSVPPTRAAEAVVPGHPVGVSIAFRLSRFLRRDGHDRTDGVAPVGLNRLSAFSVPPTSAVDHRGMPRVANPGLNRLSAFSVPPTAYLLGRCGARGCGVCRRGTVRAGWERACRGRGAGSCLRCNIGCCNGIWISAWEWLIPGLWVRLRRGERRRGHGGRQGVAGRNRAPRGKTRGERGDLRPTGASPVAAGARPAARAAEIRADAGLPRRGRAPSRRGQDPRRAGSWRNEEEGNLLDRLLMVEAGARPEAGGGASWRHSM